MTSIRGTFLLAIVMTAGAIEILPVPLPSPLASSGLNVCGACDADDQPFYFCCGGWSHGSEDGESCLTPVCNPPCQHGNCTSPDVCTCLPGYLGERCDTVSDHEFDARLLHGKQSNQGIVQVRSLTGEWSFIQGNDWTKNSSHVLCRQLGYEFAVAFSEGEWEFPEDSYPILHVKFECNGEEDTLNNCSYSDAVDVRIQRLFLAVECGTIESVQLSTYVCGTTCSQDTIARTGCKCDPLCESYGDCCPDFERNINCPSSSHAVIEESCTPIPLHHTPPYTRPSGFDVGYFMISHCSVSWPWIDDDISLMCEQEPDANDPITFTPVQEKAPEDDVRKVYRNVFCALCNFQDLNKMKVWEFEVTNSTDFDSVQKILIVDVTPPNGTAVPRTCYLNLEALTICENYNRLKDGCHNYYAPVRIETKTYRNIFCSLCSDEYPVQYSSFDDRLHLPELSDKPYPHCGFNLIDQPGVPPPWPGLPDLPPIAPDLFALFDFTEENNPSCQTGEIFDYFMQVCRLLSCPPGFRLSGGTCEDIAVHNPTIKIPSFHDNPVNGSDQDVVDCIKSMLDENKYVNGQFGNNSSLESMFEVKAHLDTAAVKLKNDSHTLAQDILNNALAFSQNNSAGNGFCNISSLTLFLLVDVDGHSGTNIVCERNVQRVGCVSSNSSYSLYFNKTHSTRYVKYIWEEKQSCYVVFVTWEVCGSLNKSLIHCPKVELPPHEYEIISTGNSTTVRHKASGKIISSEQYDLGENGTLNVCASLFYIPASGQRNRFLSYVTLSCFPLSLFATFLTFTSYCVFKELRNITGYVVMNFLVAFFIAQLMFLLAPNLINPPALCISSAIIDHFAWLAGFFWMNALSLVTTNTLTRKTVTREESHEIYLFIRYMAYAWGGPLLIVAVCASLHFCDCTDIAPIYGQKNGAICWLIGHDGLATLWGFTAPVASLLLFNMILFIYAIAKFREKMATTRSMNRSKRLKMEISIYIKLTILMGLPWLLGFLQSFVTNDILNYIYTILNSLQGVFVFWALVLTGRAGKLWRQKMCHKREISTTGNSAKHGTGSTVKTITTSFSTPSSAQSHSTANVYN